VRRSLSLFDVVCIGLNAIVGSGIFMLPDDLARDMGALSPLAFLLCGLGLLPVALCYAEAARSVDRTGGPYVYAREAFGPLVGFAVGFMCLANAVFSFAAVASAAAAYAARLWPSLGTAVALKLVALAIVVAFAALNYRGARPGSRAVNIFTFAKFGVLFTLVLALWPHAAWEHVEPTLPRGFAGVGAATFAALFAAQGFEVVPVPAGETRDPERSIPRAVVGSLLAASFVYVVVQGTLVLAYPGLSRASDAPLADAALAVVPGLALLVLCGGLVSTLGFVSGSALGTPRYLYAMGADGLLPRALASLHPRFGSPHLAVVTTGGVVALLVVAFDYRALVGMSNVAVAVQYLSTCLAVMRTRKLVKAPAVRWVVPVVGAAVSVWVFTEASWHELTWALGSLAFGGLCMACMRYVASTRPR
jgi:APA family basic amino acid/polyamine antiporter